MNSGWFLVLSIFELVILKIKISSIDVNKNKKKFAISEYMSQMVIRTTRRGFIIFNKSLLHFSALLKPSSPFQEHACRRPNTEIKYAENNVVMVF